MDLSKFQSLKNSGDASNTPRRLILLTEAPANASSVKKIIKPLNSPKIIDLSDKNIKMALHREFNGNSNLQRTEHSCGELRYCFRMKDTMEKDYLLPKLPPGTILVKQDNKFIGKTVDNSMNTLKKRLSQEITSKGSKGPLQLEKNKGSVRRNPSRMSRKKGDEDFPRPRLLAVRRKGNDINLLDKKKLKLSDVPYMNTRSVTKRLYNVGATLQAPNIDDEIELRDWPVHGMHERPVYHPQVGVAVEFIGRCFASFDGESYQEIPKNPGINITPKFYPQNKGKRDKKHNNQLVNDEITFESCMHSSLHSVLNYATQIINPDYKKIDEKFMNSRNSSKVSIEEIKNINEDKSNEVKNSSADVSRSNVKSPMNLMTIKKHSKLQQVLGRGKNTLILLKSSDNLSKSSNSPPEIDQKMKNSIEEKAIIGENEEKNRLSIKEEAKNNIERKKVIKDLISDTAILYCTAFGIHQDDLVNYIDNLRVIECENYTDYEYNDTRVSKVK